MPVRYILDKDRTIPTPQGVIYPCSTVGTIREHGVVFQTGQSSIYLMTPFRPNLVDWYLELVKTGKGITLNPEQVCYSSEVKRFIIAIYVILTTVVYLALLVRLGTTPGGGSDTIPSEGG